MKRSSYASLSFFFTFLLLFSPSVFAQQSTLTGKILDADSGDPLGFASISVLAANDSSSVGGTLTNAEGGFSLSLTAGEYLLDISFLGYEDKTMPPIALPAGQKVDLGAIKLTAEAVAIDEVEISATASQMQLDLDKRIYRVDENLAMAGSSADELLSNLPSVEVDAEGGVSLRGSQNVRILIDGKPSGLIGIGGETDGLALLQSNMIERVEVITNPSARYDAEGEVGIINIVLKKERQKGFNGSITTGTGIPHNHNLGANINYRSGMVNWFANLGGNYRRSPGGGSFYQELLEDGEVYSVFEQENRRTRSSLGGNFRTGADIIFNEFNTLTFSGLIGYDDEDNFTEIIYRDLSLAGELLEVTRRDQLEEEADRNVEFNTTFRKTYPTEDREWTSTIQYQLNDDTELADITQQAESSDNPLLQRSSNTEDEANWLIQTDYIQPFGDDQQYKFETGTRITLRTIENDYLVEEEDESGIYNPLPGFNNFFLYTENIYAGYGIFSHKMDKFSYQFGLRAEYSDIGADTMASTGMVEYIDKQYLNWFPSAFFSYEFDSKNSLQLSYSRRLSRPRFRSLLPFSNFSDARNLRIGNPDLDPEYTHSFEIGHLAYWETGSLLSSVYYRYRTGVIERILFIGADGVSFRTSANLAEQHNLGIELSGSQDITDWWNINGSLNFYGSETQGSFREQDFYARTLAFNARFNSRMTFWKNARLQLSADYRAPQMDPQGRNLARYQIDVALSKKVLKENGTITFNVRDVFNSDRWRSISFGEDFYRETDFQWRVRQFTLAFTYRINQRDNDRAAGRGGFGGSDYE